ncbi:hypothetical protein GCM10022408_18920 [Hymenobacter fastidiosus]|uniref:HTH cro/C1-type domain-containing protein n=1 Tax=Hymenobacter fastidiosus TaxID=486264 RepID=A0ABP7S6D0_9BACT
MFSAVRIQTIRKSKGFSRELLAEQSGVSLRTIQRVEQGDTVPRGHTVRALAAALGVALEDFRPEPLPVDRTENGLAPAAAPALVRLPVAPALRADPDFVQTRITPVNSWGKTLTSYTVATAEALHLGPATVPLQTVTYVEGTTVMQNLLTRFSGLGGMLGNEPFTTRTIIPDVRGSRFGVVQ